jgi:hypothetical protein
MEPYEIYEMSNQEILEKENNIIFYKIQWKK